MKPTGATKEATVTIYRVGDSIDGKRHLAYSATHAAFCGRVGRKRTARTGPPFAWMTIGDARLPVSDSVAICRQCERSQLNQHATPSTSAGGG